MATLEQIQQDLQTLPQDALDLLAQFIQLLKKSQVATQNHNSASEPSLVADTIDGADFIGSIETENLDNTPLP
ncbi:MAG: hypothetical protein WBG32_00690, partial [Nodosilinea sp.]